MKRLNQTESPIFVILCVLRSKGNPFFTFIYSTVAGVVPCGGREKSPRTASYCKFYSFPLGSLRSSFLFQKSNTAYAGDRGRMQPRKLQYCISRESNQVSNFRGFVCTFFPKAILFNFYFIHKVKISGDKLKNGDFVTKHSWLKCQPHMYKHIHKPDLNTLEEKDCIIKRLLCFGIIQ